MDFDRNLDFDLDLNLNPEVALDLDLKLYPDFLCIYGLMVFSEHGKPFSFIVKLNLC